VALGAPQGSCTRGPPGSRAGRHHHSTDHVGDRRRDVGRCCVNLRAATQMRPVSIA